MEPKVGRLVLLDVGRGLEQRLDVAGVVEEQAQAGVLSLQLVVIGQHVIVSGRRSRLGADVIEEPQVVVGRGAQLARVLGVRRTQSLPHFSHFSF